MKKCNLFILLSLIIVLSGCFKDPEKTEIRFAFQNRIGSLIPIIAVEKNFFKKYSINVKPLRFNSGPSCAEALYSGSADIGTMGDTTAVIALSKTDNLIITGSHSQGEHRHRLIALKDSKFRTLQDLKGKKIGIKKGTSTYGGFLKKIKSIGLDIKDFQIIDLSPQIMNDALFSKSIDAFAASEPTPSMAEVRGGKELTTFGNLGNKYPIMILSKNDFTLKREKDLLLFFKALKDAQNYIKNHPKKTMEILKRITNLDEKAALKAIKKHEYELKLDSEIIKSLESTAVFLKGVNKIKKIPALEKKTDYSYLKKSD